MTFEFQGAFVSRCDIHQDDFVQTCGIGGLLPVRAEEQSRRLRFLDKVLDLSRFGLRIADKKMRL